MSSSKLKVALGATIQTLANGLKDLWYTALKFDGVAIGRSIEEWALALLRQIADPDPARATILMVALLLQLVQAARAYLAALSQHLRSKKNKQG